MRRGRRAAVSRDWDGLRALLAEDVKLDQSLHPLRVGRADVGLFFTLYAKIDGVSLAPAWPAQPGSWEVICTVFEDRADLEAELHIVARVARWPDQFHPRLPLCPLCHCADSGG